jgi:transcriptional regulator with XRE-family HTH domain
MKDIKSILAENISALRLMNNMTQAELGEKLNYSDKAVSKWERGESVPDISVLLEIAELFGVTLDSLVKADNMKVAVNENKSEEVKYNRRVVSYISESVCFLIAIFAFIITTLIMQRMAFQWLYIVYALPIALIVKLVFNSVWFNPRRNYLIISALMWSLLAAIHITFLYFDINVALIYLIGVAGQAIIILWSFLRKPKKEKTK